MKRLHQGILIVSTVLGSWLGMQAVHELGHAVGAWLSGAQVVKVVLHPLTISRTDLAHNNSPLVIAWAGPVAGVLLPLVCWSVTAALRLPGDYVLRFFAGFCLVANGAYISLGSFNGIGDCGEMVRHGSPIWHLWLFGTVTVPVGIWLWHRQGRYFGLGSADGHVSLGVAYASLVGCVSLLLLALVMGGE
jgi:hypothetical protein